MATAIPGLGDHHVLSGWLITNYLISQQEWTNRKKILIFRPVYFHENVSMTPLHQN
jgi:hypothetical protein